MDFLFDLEPPSIIHLPLRCRERTANPITSPVMIRLIGFRIKSPASRTPPTISRNGLTFTDYPRFALNVAAPNRSDTAELGISDRNDNLRSDIPLADRFAVPPRRHIRDAEILPRIPVAFRLFGRTVVPAVSRNYGKPSCVRHGLGVGRPERIGLRNGNGRASPVNFRVGARERH